MVVGMSTGYLPNRNPQIRELRQIFVIHVRTIIFVLLEGSPGPRIAINHGGSTDPEWVGNAYEGDGAAGDRTQELCDAWKKDNVEHLERVTGLQ